MKKLFWLFGIDVALVLWLKSIIREEWSVYGFIQAICLLCLSTMIYAEIMRVVVDMVSPPKDGGDDV